MTDEPREQRKIVRQTVRVQPNRYQPTKADLEGDVSIDATPDQLAEALLRPAVVIEDPEA